MSLFFFFFDVFDLGHSRATYINETAECICWQPSLSIKLHRSINTFYKYVHLYFKNACKGLKSMFSHNCHWILFFVVTNWYLPLLGM